MLSVALFNFAALVALCLAMDKHFTELLARKPRAVELRVLRVGGATLLLLALLLAVHLRGLALGLVEWTALLMAGLTLWVFGLPYLPRVLLGLAGASLVLAPLLAVFAA
ncbi:DUF3325 domain-containing protein [Pseudomonas parafulva]|uniref:DUF3325 domain-containing protein n=1 Tax=Pseudomonas parafulva TaxID=157782 RepID=A0AAI8PCQ0_9PSED|nr:DUF3325 domain-containing protein [Pseudomonas parafulva]AIZ34031.1 membrane protein [Pseudomonas parafulva]AXO89745.1 DUF3325 domain-containing protein [Pseudomonas parafulva]